MFIDFVDRWRDTTFYKSPKMPRLERLQIVNTANFLNLFLNTNVKFINVPGYSEIATTAIVAGIITGVKGQKIFYFWFDDKYPILGGYQIITDKIIAATANGKLTNELGVDDLDELESLHDCVRRFAVDTYSAWMSLGGEVKGK